MPPPHAGQTLGRLQRWFQSAITHPDGVWQGVESADTRGHLDVAAEDVETVLTRSNSLPAIDRLAVYGYAYFARLLDCLREEYPVLRKALGDELFDAFAAGYLQEHPSGSYTLFDLGTRFPDFLRSTRPALEGTGDAPDWADFLIDLAAVELAFNQVFDGPGVEGETPLSPESLAAVPPDRLPDARLVAVPCLRTLAFRYPVHAYFTAVRRGEEPPPPGPAPTYLAVTRRSYVVRHYELSRPAFDLLSGLLAGETLGEAIARTVETAGDVAALEPRLSGWFRDWAAEGFFGGIQAPG